MAANRTIVLCVHQLRAVSSKLGYYSLMTAAKSLATMMMVQFSTTIIVIL